MGLAIYTGITDVDRTFPAGKRQSNVEILGETIYLKKVGDASYRIVIEKDDYDREFEWNEKAHSYCDEHSYDYIWYDKESKEWMYWIYTISAICLEIAVTSSLFNPVNFFIIFLFICPIFCI